MTDTHEDWTTEEVDAGWVEDVDEGWAEWDGDYEYVRQGRRSRLKIFFGILFGLLLAGLLVAGGLSLWVVRQINPPGEPGAKVTVTVDEGMTTSEIADLLERRGVVTNATVFRWYVSYKKAGPFSPGYFELEQRSSMGDVIKVLETPPPVTFTNVTFPEGFTLDKFASRLADKVPRLSADKFLAAANSGQLRSKYEPEGVNNLEGLLFPDTYQVASNDDEAKVIARLMAQMEKVATEEGVDYAPFKLNLSAYQVLTVASIIEKEAKTDADRPKIARVIYNRLAQNMNLEIDATVIYAMGGNVDRLTFDDINNTNSPYNTYKNPGLPPGPISMPGRASIHAAMNPADGPWLYYVVIDKDGNHAFATTLKQHEKNIKIAEQNGVR
ncbi:MAG TPA: endolytic transglycosylase MltG [Acidimicrobiales bacterium]|nr:endolytic transglycosylase MltG [Acidimicrobiales bacterium]